MSIGHDDTFSEVGGTSHVCTGSIVKALAIKTLLLLLLCLHPQPKTSDLDVARNI